VEDVERNNGKDQPYFMDEKLLDLMGLKNEATPASPHYRQHTTEDEDDDVQLV